MPLLDSVPAFDPFPRAESAPPVPVRDVRASSFTFPTDAPESDGTLEWTETTLVLVEVEAEDKCGIGYTYSHPAAEAIVRDLLAPRLRGRQLDAHKALWNAMIAAVRNLGVGGITAMAVSAVDNALWDLRGKLRNQRVLDLFDSHRNSVPAYGSGGFTSYDTATLRDQLEGWAAAGLPAVKMKVGRDPGADPQRVCAARSAIRDEVKLFVDANNAYADAAEAVTWARRFADAADVSWLEQPLVDTDLDGMAAVCRESPGAVDVTDGEYGFTVAWFEQHIKAKAAHVFQPDMTRCLGLTGFLQIAACCEANQIPVSSHCAPSLHATAGCLASTLRHAEYFHDHVRIERTIFDGAPGPDASGRLTPPDGPGFGLVFKPEDAEHLMKGQR